MADLKEKVQLDIENISRVLEELADCGDLTTLSTLELAGVATLLHNYYSGCENILKRILIENNITLPQGSAWHKQLLILSVENKIISPQVKEKLGEFMAFWHFFSHAYALDLYADRMEPLVKSAPLLFDAFRNEIRKHY